LLRQDVQSGRGQIRALVAFCAALLALLAAPSVAAGKAGALDRGFNGDGKVVTAFPDNEVHRFVNYTLPFEFAPGRIAMASGPGGKLVAASSQAIVRYLPNGRPDPGFGGNGAVPIGLTEGFRFQLADVAVDSKGRVLIAGMTQATNGIGIDNLSLPGPLPSIGTIRRYNPDGQLDPSFGSGGVVNSFFGAPPATFEGKPYSEPAVSLVGLAIDREDRPIVTGSAVAEVGRCGPSQARYERSQAFVARRAVDGGPDPSFAGGATAAIDGLAWLTLPTPTPSGLFAVGAADDPCRNGGPDEPSVLTSSDDNGLNSTFDGDGLWSRPFTRVSDLAVAPGGKIVLLTRTIELRGGYWVESAGSLTRLRADGSLDRRFGQEGRADLPLPKHSTIAAIATDAKGNVLLAGDVRRVARRKQRPHRLFMLIRMTPQGAPDARRFGHRGRVVTSFGSRANVHATDVLVDPAGQIAVGGKFSGPSSTNAFAIARYLGKP
jgi:uncharacterized delta-60 repeat protein